MTHLLTNLDFEYAWSGGSVPKAVGEVSRRWAAILRLVCPEGQVVDPVDFGGEVAAGEELWPWGWTPAVVEFARSKGLQAQAPPLDVVERVNSKVFSHGLEKRLGLALPGARLVNDVAQLQGAVAEIDGPWVLKHPWGVSGRRQMRGEAGQLSENQRRWASSQLKDHPVILEPRLQISEESSVHFEITEQQDITHLGNCRLLADRTGTFRGINVDPKLEVPKEIIDGAREAAQAVAEQGYFGPLGIDAMVGRWAEVQIVRPITEINARHSFGRLALALYELLGQGRLLWHHPRRNEKPPSGLKRWPEAFREGRFRLPEEVDPGGQSGTWVELFDGEP